MKRFTLLILLVDLTLLASGQALYIGAKSGGHIGSAFIDHTIINFSMNEGFESGFHGGVFFKYLPEPREVFLKSGLQMSINYIQKGWKQNFLNDEPTYKAQMSYIEIPIEGIGYFGRKNRYFITAGFFFEFLYNTSLDENPTFDTIVNDATVTVIPNQVGGQDFYTYEGDRDNEVGYGFRASGGIFRDFLFGQLHLEGFFSYTISNFIDPGSLLSDIPDISNLWTTGVSLGYLFPLKKKKK